VSVTALVLGAGAGTRFGAAPKQLAEVGGKPLLQHAIDLAQPLGGVLVLGARAEEVRASVDPGRLEVVVCDTWDQGQSASLRAGLAALPDAEAVLVLLGDQPRIGRAAVERVLAARDPARHDAVRAAYDGRPGHPVALERALIDRAQAALRGDQGFRDLLGAAHAVECGDIADPTDVDTPEDLEVLQP
jgi:CTP:molybdopterin cytidylyltransferase MocA